MSLVMRKPVFCICENKDPDRLRGNCEADQRLCFRYTDSTIPLLPKSEISSLLPSSVAAQSGLCRTWSKTPKTGFLRTRLKCKHVHELGLLSKVSYFAVTVALKDRLHSQCYGSPAEPTESVTTRYGGAAESVP